MSNLSLGSMREIEGLLTNKRAFLTLSLASAAASCALPLVPKTPLPAVVEVELPNWDMIKRNYDISFTGPEFNRLRRVGQKVLSTPTRDGPWQFGVVKDDYDLVLAFRGNGLIVSTHLLGLCENDGQLGALLAWVAMFPLPALRVTGDRRLRLDMPAIMRADIATIGALAKAGYDPRDALVIARRVPATAEVRSDLELPRWLAMENELRALGYQV